MSLSGIETPQTAWRRNSKATTCNNGDCSDTYSDAGVILNSGSTGSTSSGAGSCKICEIHHRTHHQGSDEDCDHHCQHALSRKNSGGSGYQSNDSCCSGSGHDRGHVGHMSRLPPKAMSVVSSSCQCTSACSSCATSLAGSLMSNRRSRPKLSLPSSHSHINLSAAGLGSPLERSQQGRGRSSSPQKVLVMSAVDKAGKMMYSSNSNLEASATESTNSSRMHHHQSMSSLHQHNNDDENHVMSMKKSAEIAAVFSGAKINQMTDIVDHKHNNPDEIMELSRYKRQQFSESNMHSSLGYFP